MAANDLQARGDGWRAADEERDGEIPEMSRQPVTRKACNECRQQKLRCNMIQNPLTPCARCSRLHIECRIDAHFKRVDKRKERHRRDSGRSLHTDHAPNSQDIQVEAVNFSVENASTGPSRRELLGDSSSDQSSNWAQQLQSGGPEVSAMFRTSNLETGRPYAPSENDTLRRLDGIALHCDVVKQLFEQYFIFYHPFLPFLDPRRSPDEYYQQSPLLYWAIIGVASRRYSSDLTLLPSLSISVPRLLWSTLQSVPQNYHVVKALCVLCAWPFPKSNSAQDPTFMLTGTMMHLALQVGLHMPDYAQDFSKSDLALRQDDLKDRCITWATCNIVAQSVATGLGQPSTTKYDWSLEQRKSWRSYLPEELSYRLRIENFCERVSQALYGSSSFTTENSERLGRFQLLTQEFLQLESELSAAGPHTLLHLRGAQVHLRLYAHFDFRSIPPLLSLHHTCCRFLTQALSPELDFLSHSPYYIFQLILASGFTLLRFLRSSLTQFIDVEAGKLLFNSVISACRKISISNNDLPGRLAEVLAQLWAWGNHETPVQGNSNTGTLLRDTGLLDVSLTIKSRMSMSIVYDSLWRWRTGFKNDVAQQLTYSAPTNPAVVNWHENSEQISDVTNDDTGSTAIHQVTNLDMISLDDMFPLDWAMDGAMEFPDFVPGDS